MNKVTENIAMLNMFAFYNSLLKKNTDTVVKLIKLAKAKNIKV